MMFSEAALQLSWWVLAALFAVGIMAGFIDTLAGGGGMLTIPALLLAGLPPENALATNKLQGSFGTVSASIYFIRRGHLDFRRLLPGVAACIFGSALGTLLVQILPHEWLRKLIPLLLMIIAAVFWRIPALGSVETEARLRRGVFLVGILAPIGFYDGFIGPGTGSFICLALIALQGCTLQAATIEAKLYNAATNLSSLLVFFIGGKIIWTAGLCMAAGQLIGARLASAMIVSKGNALIRPMVIGMSVAMSLYLMAKTWLHWF